MVWICENVGPEDWLPDFLRKNSEKFSRVMALVQKDVSPVWTNMIFISP